VSGFGAFLQSAVGSLWRERLWSADRFRAHQRMRLVALLEHARSTTPIYRERLAGLVLDDPDVLSKIRPITKSEIMARFDETIANGAITRADVEAFTEDRARVGQLYRDDFMLATTSGTTGRVGYFVTDRLAWARLNGALLARILRHRLIPREIVRFCFGRRYRMAMAVATEGHFITRLIATFRPLVSRAIVDLRAFSISGSREELLDALARFRPHYLHSYPTYLELLAHERLRGRLDIDPEFISLGSEPVTVGARQLIARAFPNAEISETYGATECLAMANQCKHQNLHVNEDVCILEAVDANDRPVPFGTASAKVLLTNLENRAQPLLRYELNDSITPFDEPCACGAGMARIRVEGRSDDTFFLHDASGAFTPHPPVPFEVLFLNVEHLAQYQLVHEEQNRLVVRFVTEPGGDTDRVRAQLSGRFEQYLAQNRLDGCVRVEVVGVERIEREAVGHKLRQIYSKVPRPVSSLG
jgi:phenylacetate-CoA ligase